MPECQQRRYRIEVCSECGEHQEFRKECYWCGGSVESIAVLPVDFILDKRDEFLTDSSALPQLWIEQFVHSLLSEPSS